MIKKPTRYYSKRQENAVAKKLGGKRTANSGTTAFSKGDVVLENWLIECKTCTAAKASFSIKREWLDKNRQEAFSTGKMYNALCFDYGNGSDRYYVVNERIFKELVQLLEENS